MSDNVFWASLWAMILSAVVTLASLLQYNCCRHVQRMAELGYQEEMVVGVGSTVLVWRKVAGPVQPATPEIPSGARSEGCREEVKE